MASSIFFVSPILLVILFHLLLAKEPTCYASIPPKKNPPTGGTHTGSRAILTPVRLPINRPINRYTQNTLSNDRNGEENYPGLPVTSTMKEVRDVYTVNISLGTPPVSFSAIMDTGSNLIWIKCKQDKKSFSHHFDPSKSSSYVKANKNCDDYEISDCKQNYGDGSDVNVTLGQETITIGPRKIPDVIFACGIPSDHKQFERYDGVLGMGPGDLSLVSKLDKHVFLYCLASRFPPLEVSKQSILLTESLASSALASTKTSIQTMPLVKQEGKQYYYISLEGISVGGTRLPVTKSDFAINANKDGGMIIDSGTTFTYLEERIVDMIYNEFINQTKLKKLSSSHNSYYKGLQCFKPPNKNNIIPNIVFHFEGANWELPRENYIYEKEGNAKACLAFIANKESDKLSIFGNMQQQNMMVLYDLDSNNLSFGPAKCDEL